MIVNPVIKSLYRSFEESLATLISDILAKIQVSLTDPASDLLRKPTGDVKTNLDVLNKAIWRVRKSEYTEKLMSADAVRDSYFDALLSRIDSDMDRVYETEIMQNAKTLKIQLQQVGKVKVNNYPDQTAQLVQLFTLFDTTESAVLIDSNGMRTLYDNLKRAQSEFNTLWNNRLEGSADAEIIPELRVATNTLFESVNTLFKKLEVYADDNGEPFTTIIGSINSLITESEKVQRGRVSRGEGEKKEVEKDAVIAK